MHWQDENHDPLTVFYKEGDECHEVFFFLKKQNIMFLLNNCKSCPCMHQILSNDLFYCNKAVF